MTQPSRLPALDLLRGAAILLVMGRHIPMDPSSLPDPLAGLVDTWARAGWIGVDLFFVLSGFLVSGLLFTEYHRHGDVHIGRFLGRRGFKIYPAFYAFLLLTTLYRARHAHIAARAIVAEGLFLQGYFPGMWRHTWSLAVEEHFYFLLALATVLLLRFRFTWLVPATLIIGVVELALRVVTAYLTPNLLTLRIYPTHLRLDALMFGVLLAYFYHFRRDQLTAIVHTHRRLIAVASAAAIAPCLVWDVTNPLVETAGLTLLYLGFGGILLLFVLERAVEARPIAWIGTYSYSIYLWHFAVSNWTAHLFEVVFGHWPSPLTLTLTYLVASLAVGVLMARLVEMPFLMLRDRWLPSRSRPLPESPRAEAARRVDDRRGEREVPDLVAIRVQQEQRNQEHA